MVVKTEPIDINERFFSLFIPNLKSSEVAVKIIRTTKIYLPISISGIFSESTS